MFIHLKLYPENILILDDALRISNTTFTRTSLINALINHSLTDEKFQKQYDMEIKNYSRELKLKDLRKSCKDATYKLYWKKNVLNVIYDLCLVDFFTLSKVDMVKVSELINLHLQIFSKFSDEHRQNYIEDYNFVKSLKNETNLISQLMKQRRYKILEGLYDEQKQIN